MNYEVIREDESKLTRHRWRFWVNGTRVILDKFYRETRPSTRHKYRWIAPDVYDRTDRRYGLLPVHMVPQPKDVCLEVLRQIINDMRVVVQDRRDVEAPFGPPALTDDQLRDECVAIVRRGDGFIPAVKLYREQKGAGLKEALDTIRGWTEDPKATLASDKRRRK